MSYYSTAAQIERLCIIARSWIGTPFVPNAKVKGAGVSCQMFVASVYKEDGFLPASVQIPEGPANWAWAHKESLIEQFIDTELADYFGTADTPQPGDLLGFRMGGCVHHLGISLGDPFVHALRHCGVTESRIDDATFLKRLARVWRPLPRWDQVTSQVRNPNLPE